MNKWYFIYMARTGNDSERIGPFDTKAEAMMHVDWATTRREGSLYHHPTKHGYLGRKKDFMAEGFDWAFPEDEPTRAY